MGGVWVSVTWGWDGGVLTFIIKTVFLSRPAVDIRLIALIAMVVLGYVSTGFERKRNADPTMLQSLKMNIVLGVYRPAFRSLTRGGGLKKVKKIA